MTVDILKFFRQKIRQIEQRSQQQKSEETLAILFSQSRNYNFTLNKLSKLFQIHDLFLKQDFFSNSQFFSKSRIFSN